jgi:hypothetical protein
MGIQYSATKLNPQPIAKSALPHGVVAFLRPLISFDSLDPGLGARGDNAPYWPTGQDV